MKEKCSCENCENKAVSSFRGMPYCNKHWLRLYNNGTLEKKNRQRNNRYEIKNNILVVTTAKGDIILCNPQDNEKVKKYSWCVSKTGYAVANIKGKVTKMHRYILGIENPKVIVDHINGNPLDNRRENLRLCTREENAKNHRAWSKNKTGIAGIQYMQKQDKYRVRITVEGKEIFLGYYKTLKEAKDARQKAETYYYKEFAPCISRTSISEISE